MADLHKKFRVAVLSVVKHDYLPRAVAAHPRFELVVVTDDAPAARQMLKGVFAPYAATTGYNRFFRWIGYEEEATAIAEAAERGDRAAMIEAYSDEMANDVLVIGNADEVHSAEGRRPLRVPAPHVACTHDRQLQHAHKSPSPGPSSATPRITMPALSALDNAASRWRKTVCPASTRRVATTRAASVIAGSSPSERALWSAKGDRP